MFTSRVATRAASRLRPSNTCHRCFRLGATSPYAVRRQTHFVRSVLLVAVFGSAASAYQWANGGGLIRTGHAESPPSLPEDTDPTPIFEKPKKRKGSTKEQIRDQISSQHLQVKRSWENPGVWSWGANDGKVAAPDAKDEIIRNPRWLEFFDGKLLRDLQLTRDFGAAVTENGDLLQWGSAYSENETTPVATLKGKNITSIQLTQDRIVALSSGGEVYSLSVSQEEQLMGPKPTETSWWWPFTSSRSPISYRTITPQHLGWMEKVSQIAGGLDHALLLTSSGRVFAAAAGNSAFPAKGQLGIPGLTWFTKPSGPYDQAHEIQGLHGFKIKHVAAGDYHSLALDSKGRVFAWGDNHRGQLGIGDTSKETTFFDTPTLVPMSKLYKGTSQKPIVTSVFAGGNTTFITVDAERVAAPNADPDDVKSGVATRGLGRITADTWACGHGIWGQLGNGRWTHVQALPTKIVPLSGLFEYDEVRRRAIPIRMRSISVGENHCAAIMDNVTYVDASSDTSENDTNWGADVLFFGNNEFFQLGTGKRNNVVNPTYIQPLDRQAEVIDGKRPKREEHRFHATPMSKVQVGNRRVQFEQRIVCGRGVTAVYSGV